MKPEFNFNRNERRSSTRIPIGLETTYKISESTAPVRLGMTADLSLDGMRLCQIERIEPGREVSLTFLLPTQGQMTLAGKVVWCQELGSGQQGYQAGIQWLRPTAATRARLNAFYIDRIQRETPVTGAPVEPAESFRLWWRMVEIAVIGFAILIVSNFISWFGRTGRPSSEQSSKKVSADSLQP